MCCKTFCEGYTSANAKKPPLPDSFSAQLSVKLMETAPWKAKAGNESTPWTTLTDLLLSQHQTTPVPADASGYSPEISTFNLI